MEYFPQISLSALFAEAPLNILSGTPDATPITGIALDNLDEYKRSLAGVK